MRKKKNQKNLGSIFLRRENSFLGLQIWYNLVYRIVASASPSRFEAHQSFLDFFEYSSMRGQS